MSRASLLFLCWSLLGCQVLGLGTEGGPLSPTPEDKAPPAVLTASCPAHPRACNVAGWCWEHSLPPDMKQKSIRGTSCNNIWVVGEGTKTIHQWNGTVWVVHEHTGPDNLLAVWGSDADNAWAVGVGGAILAWDGVAWLPQSSASAAQLNGVWGSDAKNVWVVGDGGTILKWNGTRWTAQTSGVAVRLKAVWGSDAKNVWVVGDGGTVLRWDGTGWTAQSSGVTEDLGAIWGSDVNDIWAGGNLDGVLKWDGKAWSLQRCSACNNRIVGIAGRDVNHVWTLGSAGVSAWDGVSWSIQPLSDSIYHGIWVDEVNNVWFAKESFAREPTVGALTAIQGTDANFILAAGYRGGFWPTGLVMKWDGKAWSSTPAAHGLVSSLYVSDANNAWIVDTYISAQSGPFYNVEKWDGLAWSFLTYSPDSLASVGGSDKDHVWVAAASGSIYSLTGDLVTSDGSAGSEGIWAGDANNVWSVGDHGRMYRRMSSRWGSVSTPSMARLHSVWGSDPRNVWAVGDGGAIFKWDGARVSLQSSGTTQNLHGIWGRSATEVWAVGEQGTLLKWDGAIWTPQFVGTSIDLNAIWGTGTHLWMVGEHAAILHKGP